MTGIGPQLPPHLMKLSKNEQEEKSLESASETNIYGPALPPHLQKRIEKEEPATGPRAEGVESDGEENRSTEESDDEIIGPALHMKTDASNSTSIAEQFEARSKAMKNKLTGKPQCDEKLERESWMLELPPALSKNFGLGPRTFRAKATEMGDQSVWTDTPADRERKRQEAAEKSGKEKKVKAPEHLPKKEDIEVQNQVTEYNKRTRPHSLMEIHQEKRQKCSTEPTTRRPFDRDRDLSLHRTDSKEKEKFIQSAKSFNSKFSSGSYEKKFL